MGLVRHLCGVDGIGRQDVYRASMGWPIVHENCAATTQTALSTAITQLQIPVFISELEALRSSVTDDALRTLAEKRLEWVPAAEVSASILEEYEADVRRVSSRAVLDHLDAVLALAHKAVEGRTFPKCYGD